MLSAGHACSFDSVYWNYAADWYVFLSSDHARLLMTTSEQGYAQVGADHRVPERVPAQLQARSNRTGHVLQFLYIFLCI
jgi:hypothetical protein